MGWEWRVFWRVDDRGTDTTRDGASSHVTSSGGGDGAGFAAGGGAGGAAGGRSTGADSAPAAAADHGVGSVEAWSAFLAAFGSDFRRSADGLPRREVREDIYYVVSEKCGPKHRSGKPDALEVKLLEKKDVDFAGLEKWKKTRLSGKAAAKHVASLRGPSGEARPARLLVHKQRASTSLEHNSVELTEVTVVLEGSPSTSQRWRSACIEGGKRKDIARLARAVLSRAELVPSEHVAGG
eukprot:CAMPEP_0203809596 /NCGR_PEP_ID=MMETSP0115-20131106/2382_1 /ASSEMBLY_ACC=CAM_ASM_000227 /TAXON_ID=33651 /ORGANISM="Bicosoecid sp, Strain ms1" /LENGTH=237 /DNA_ID=CAMNT_0050718339 /DNA_START=171 /DNA_END=880 /DNA_ORIENTATION=-